MQYNRLCRLLSFSKISLQKNRDIAFLQVRVYYVRFTKILLEKGKFKIFVSKDFQFYVCSTSLGAHKLSNTFS